MMMPRPWRLNINDRDDPADLGFVILTSYLGVWCYAHC